MLTFFNLIILISNGNNKNYKKRNIEEEDLSNYRDLSIHLDFCNFNQNFPVEKFGGAVGIFNKSMNEAKNILETMLLIYPELSPENGLTILEEYKDFLGISCWDIDQYIVDFPKDRKLTAEKKNLFIFFKFDVLNNVDMYSKISFTYANYMPVIGLVTINKNMEPSKIDSNYLTLLFLQQFIKILGFQFTHKAEHCDFDGSISAEPDDEDDTKKFEELEVSRVYVDYMDAEKVIDYANEYFGCDEIEEIELELDEYNNVYWPSKLFLGDIMTKFDNYEEKFISGFTLALLEDTGYLHVKREYAYTGGLMRFGKHKGYAFFLGQCVPNDDENSITFSNEFYLPKETNDFPEPSCSSSRLGKTVYMLHSIADGDNPEIGYNNGAYTGLKQTNYCPIAEYTPTEGFSIGFCSDANTPKDTSIYEETGSESFCVLSSLISNQFKSVCYKMSCSPKSLTIKIGNDYIVCPREGGQIQPPGYEGYLLCPDYNLICTTEKLCNNLLDCFNKKSVEKENSLDYEEDYIIKTTQNSKKYKSEPPELSIGWELTDDGFCPKYCMKCDSNKKCLKCKPEYKIVENKCSVAVPNCKKYLDDELCEECNDELFLTKDKKECITQENIDSQLYFLDNESRQYINCAIINNCMKCTSGTECIKCQNGFELNNNICNIIKTDDDDDDKLSTGAIIGIVFGSVGFLLIVLGIIYYILKKEKKDNQITQLNNEEKIVEEKLGGDGVCGNNNNQHDDEIQIEDLVKQNQVEIHSKAKRKISNK